MGLNISRTLFIGDVHGCFHELEALMDKLNPSASDRVILLGDLINKGPFSWEVLKFVRAAGYEVLLGNHEYAFLKGVEHKRLRIGSSMDRLAQQMGPELQDWCRYMSTFKPYIQTKEFLAVHAGLRPDLAVQKTSSADLTMIRTWDGRGYDLQSESNPPWYDFYRDPQPIIYGHWAKRGLNLRGNTLGIDSGCVYGKSLSALIFPERRLVAVPARQAYVSVGTLH